MPRNSYSSPVNQLLDYQPGTGQLSPDEWPDYQELGITAEDIPELIRMATDEDLGDFRKRNYQLKWLNQNIPFGQKWISLQSRLDWLHGFLGQGNPFLVNNVA